MSDPIDTDLLDFFAAALRTFPGVHTARVRIEATQQIYQFAVTYRVNGEHDETQK